VPLFGVLVADWIIRRRYDADSFFAAPPLRPAMIGAWLAGFAFYQCCFRPARLVVDLIRHTHPQSLRFGASLPASPFLHRSRAGQPARALVCSPERIRPSSAYAKTPPDRS